MCKYTAVTQRIPNWFIIYECPRGGGEEAIEQQSPVAVAIAFFFFTLFFSFFTPPLPPRVNGSSYNTIIRTYTEIV